MASRMMMGGGAVAGGLMLGHKMMSVNQEFIEKADNAAEAYDTLARSLNIQAGLTGAESTAARDRIQRIAMRSATDKGFTYATATQLASSGFSATEATGNSLNEMLKGVNAMPAPGGRKVDPVQLAEASAAYMTSQNMDKTGGNLRNVLAGVQNLYKSTNFQLSDFSELAGQADTMRGRMTMGEQFGAFSVLRDVGKTAEEATTALRNIAIRTQTTEGSPAKTAALATLGLKPEDIDMQGESFTDVLDRLAKAIEGKDAPKVTTALEEVFGERTLAGITRLIEDRGKVKDRAAAIGNVEQYEADATTMSTGSAAAKRRQELQAETWAKDHSQKDDLLKQELSQQALEQGGSPFGVWGRGALNWGLRGMGVERDTAAAMAFESFGGDGRLSEAKRTLGEKGVKLTPGISYQDANGNLVPDTRSYDSDLIWQREFDAKHRGDSYTPKAGTPQAAVLEELEAKRKAGLLRPVGQTNAARDFVGPVQPVAQVEAPSNNRGPGRELPERTRETALLEKIADGITLIAAGQGTPIVVRPSDRRAPGSNASLLSSTG